MPSAWLSVAEHCSQGKQLSLQRSGQLMASTSGPGPIQIVRSNTALGGLAGAGG